MKCRLQRKALTLIFVLSCISLAGCSATAPEEDLGFHSECVDNQPLPEQGSEVLYDVRPRVVKRVEPEYPRLAQAAGLTGDVVVSALVDRCGRVRDVVVSKGSEHSGFNEPALRAVKQWRFEPAKFGGAPVAVWSEVTVEFRLSSEMQPSL